MECNYFIYAQRLNVLDIHFSSVMSDREGPLPECSVSVKETWNKDDSSWSTHVCVYCKLSQLRTKTTGFAADSDSRTVCTVAKVTSGKGHTQTTLVNGRDSAHDWVWTLVHACVTIVAVLTDRRQSQSLLLFIVQLCAMTYINTMYTARSGLPYDDERSP